MNKNYYKYYKRWMKKHPKEHAKRQMFLEMIRTGYIDRLPKKLGKWRKDRQIGHIIAVMDKCVWRWTWVLQACKSKEARIMIRNYKSGYYQKLSGWIQKGEQVLEQYRNWKIRNRRKV